MFAKTSYTVAVAQSYCLYKTKVAHTNIFILQTIYTPFASITECICCGSFDNLIQCHIYFHPELHIFLGKILYR